MSSSEEKPAGARAGLGPHALWAGVVLLLALLLVLAWWLTLRAPGRLLQPRVVEQLQTSLSGMAGRNEAFLVAYAFSTRTSAQATKSYFLGDLAVGSSEVQAAWAYSVDFGVDLAELRDLPGSLACDESTRTCTWTLPAPAHRPPAIDSSSIRLDTRGSLLVTDGLEEGHRDEVLRQLSVLTREEIRRPEFQQLVRENVRSGLEQLARNLVLDAGLGPLRIEVVFRDDAEPPEGRRLHEIEPETAPNGEN